VVASIHGCRDRSRPARSVSRRRRSTTGSNAHDQADSDGDQNAPAAAGPSYAWLIEFSPDLRERVLAGDITVSIRLWRRAKVRVGGRYRVGVGQIHVDSVEVLPFSAVTPHDVRLAGESDLESLRERAAHAGPIDEDTLVYRIEFHTL